ncbi:aminoglycoside phosphotransferase family protein [Nocardia colli]|uniref:aminoglycoside phosphotransferase family protein n=1 Tax=Nocardia colli TaxID=2545717 RepID=UPI0035E2D839
MSVTQLAEISPQVSASSMYYRRRPAFMHWHSTINAEAGREFLGDSNSLPAGTSTTGRRASIASRKKGNACTTNDKALSPLGSEARAALFPELRSPPEGPILGAPRPLLDTQSATLWNRGKRMNHKLWLLGRFATVGGHVLREKVIRPKAHKAGDVPVSGETITPEWLTAVLCRDVPDARVCSFDTTNGSHGTSTRVAIRVDYNETGRRAALPTELFAKTTTSLRQRMLLGGAKVIDGETQFFMNFRPHVEMEAPQGYWGAVDPASWRSIALMEDIAATRGAVFTEPNAPVTRDQIEDLVRNLARLHGTFWEHPSIAALHTPNDMLEAIRSAIDMKGRSAVGLRRAEDVVPATLHGQHERLWTGVERALDIATEDMPRTMLHGDPHIGQTYVTHDGRMGFADWQVIMQGGWAHDFAYTVNSGCEPDDRRAWDRGLLELYLYELGRAGGTVPSFEAAWLAYRQQSMFAYAAWAFTIGRAVYQPKMQSVETCRTLMRRITTALDDLESLDALGV